MHIRSSSAAGDALLREQIRAEAIHLLYRQSRVAMVVSLINSIFLVYVLLGVVPSTPLLTWFAVIITLTTVRGALTFSYFSRPRSLEASRRWGTIATVGSLLSGLAWGSAGVVLYVPDQVAYQALLYFLIGAIGAGAFASYTSFIPAFYNFFIPALLPIIFMLFRDGDRIHYVMAIWGSSFFAAFLYFARNAYQSQIEAIRLRLENQTLLDELRIKHHAAEQANSSKTKFLAAASHDLRQPLFALGLYTEMLEIETDIDKTHEIGSLIRQSFFSLKGLLDSLLDISRLDAGVVKVEKKNFYLQELFDRILFDYEPMAIDKDIRLRVVDTSTVAYSDPVLIERVLRNLVSNAINYTREGGVLLGVKRVGGQYEIRVYDTGTGIPQEELGNIFEEFHQLANPERDRSKGIGLGLSIVQRLLSLLGENITAHSEFGRGTAMCFSLQRGEGKVPLTLTERTPETRIGARLLIIEDDEEVRRSMSAFLKELGYVVLSADSGGQALQLLEQETTPPDMIISDYRLRDGENGVDAAEAVLARLDTKLPVMIITGDTAPQRLREALSHGYRLQHKPVVPSELRRAVAQMLNHQERQDASPETGSITGTC
jgi:signal transduction histidine kinase/CheY-like chemotaxis protein